jgi:ribosomal protein L22
MKSINKSNNKFLVTARNEAVQEANYGLLHGVRNDSSAKIAKLLLTSCLAMSVAQAELIRVDSKDVVVDTTRNLMWQDNSEVKSNEKKWEDGLILKTYPAKEYCQNLNFAGYDDWYLPNKEELLSIVDKANEPTIVKVFQNIVFKGYWSSTAFAGNTDKVWFVHFFNAFDNANRKTYSYYVRCVRAEHSFNYSTLQDNSIQKLKKDSTAPIISITSPSTSRALKKSNESRVQIIGNATDASGIAEVTINGTMATIDASGNFSGEAFLKVGENNILVTALDIYGNKTDKAIKVVREGGVVDKAQIAHTELENEVANLSIGKKYAIIIGINSYKNGIDELKTPVNDAKEVAKVLQNSYGFETILLTDSSATKDSILETIENIAKKTKANDQMIIYYGGHGYFEKQTNTSYWLPSDAKSNSYVKGIKSKDITDLLKMSPSKQVLVVADSCYSGTMERNTNISWNSMNETRANFLKKQLREPSRILLSSGGNEPVSDGNEKHSVFAGFFLKKLQNFDKNVFTAEELYGSYKESVSGNSDQTPEYKTIGASGHESGDFVFVKKQ